MSNSKGSKHQLQLQAHGPGRQTRAVRVATRIRPNLPGIDAPISSKEILRSCVVATRRNHIGFRFVDNHNILQQEYKFDSIYTEHCSQEDIFTYEVEPLLNECFDGKTSTLLCYGPTGSGKTFTCVGTEGNIGMIPRSIEYALRRKQEIINPNNDENDNIENENNSNNNNDNNNNNNNSKMQSNEKLMENICEIKLSCIEIYNEKVYDLLGNRQNLERDLQIFSTKDDGIVIQDASQIGIKNMDDFHHCYSIALNNRRTAFTKLNATSSRSHAIYFLYIDQQLPVIGKNKTCHIHGKFSIVDLAGSENNKLTENQGKRLKESSNINKSLFTLGHVIDALKNKQLPPYRSSKLTRILSDSLGGHACSTMLCCVSQALNQSTQTRKCLAFASNTRKIHNVIVSNIETKSNEEEVKNVKKEKSIGESDNDENENDNNESNGNVDNDIQMTTNSKSNEKKKNDTRNEAKKKRKMKSKEKDKEKKKEKSNNSNNNNNNSDDVIVMTEEQLKKYQKQWEKEYESKIEAMIDDKVKLSLQEQNQANYNHNHNHNHYDDYNDNDNDSENDINHEKEKTKKKEKKEK